MNIITDTFIEIGDQHKICEDCILSIENPKGIILSDGCSSSKNTDMGSRILCHLAKKHIHPTPYPYWSKIISEANIVANMLNLNSGCLDATLIIAYLLPASNILSIYFYGDGYLITQDLAGKIDITCLKYTPEAPYYLSYELDYKRRDAYLKMNVAREVNLNGSPQKDQFSQYPFAWSTYWYRTDIDLSNQSCVIIASDGLGTFMKKGASVPVQELVSSFMNYPVRSGVFLKRTMNHQLRKLAADGIKHYDDLSMGAFVIDHEKINDGAQSESA